MAAVLRRFDAVVVSNSEGEGTGVETDRYNSCVGFRLNRSLLEDQILFQERATETVLGSC